MHRRFVLLLASLACATSPQFADAATEDSGWQEVPKILSRVQAPKFADRQFIVSDYGAASDGKTDCKSAFEKAISQCSDGGGGKVNVPPGKWLVRGPIHLKSGVNLHLESGATVQFSTDPADYLPLVRTRFEGNELMNFSPLLYAYEQHDIAITGSGIFDGQASKNAWWGWKSSSSNDRKMLQKMSDGAMPIERRKFGQDHQLRPNFVQFNHCTNVLIDGVTFTNSPMWLLHPLLCQNVTIRGVTMDSHGPNNDGCDPESCRDVLIEKCTFNTGDDCIAIKSGRGRDGRLAAAASENIIVRDCQMKDGHGGVVLGSEMSGGIRNVFVENCKMGSPNLVRAIRLKSNSSRGGFLENLFVRNIAVDQVKEAVVRINLLYEKDRGKDFPTVSNIHLVNIKTEKCERAFYFVGLPESTIKNVVIEDCTVNAASSPSVFEYTDDVQLRNFRLLPRNGLDND